jgi:hypothetical protein
MEIIFIDGHSEDRDKIIGGHSGDTDKIYRWTT